MNLHRFRLERYKIGGRNRYRCPSCQGRRTFTLYIDTITGEYIHDTVGRCDRLHKCAYHYPPKDYFKDNDIDLYDLAGISRCVSEEVIEPPSYIDLDLLKRSLNCYEQNNFAQFLCKLFGNDNAIEAVERYYIGTSRKWPGATVFWQVDKEYRIRTGKIMLYDLNTGKRNKGDQKYISWVHRTNRFKDSEFNLSQCFFGEHLLLTDLDKKIAIVESEKTAVVASMLLPEFIWLASGGKEGLSEEKAIVLKGRNVILFPDAGCYDHWKKKANRLSHICNIDAYGGLETNISVAEKKEGYDIADYLIKHQEDLRSCSCSN